MMTPIKYLNTVLTVIAMLMLLLVWSMTSAHTSGFPFTFEPTVSAQSQPTNVDVAFAASINPRRFVFWDKHAGVIYIYNDDGKVDASWAVGKLGEPLRKQ